MDIEFSELNVQLCVEWLKDIQLIHHARPTAAIRAGRTGESDVGEAPGHQRPAQPHARLTGPSFELQIARAEAVPVEVRPITNPPWRSAAIPCISPGLRF